MGNGHIGRERERYYTHRERGVLEIEGEREGC